MKGLKLDRPLDPRQLTLISPEQMKALFAEELSRVRWHSFITLYFNLSHGMKLFKRDLAAVSKVLKEYTLGVHILEFNEPEITLHALMGIRRDKDVDEFLLRLFWAMRQGRVSIRTIDYKPTRGAGYYLDLVTHPCAILSPLTREEPTPSPSEASTEHGA
jgi:hypothetical protein